MSWYDDGEGWEDVPLPHGDRWEDGDADYQEYDEDDTAWYSHPPEPDFPDRETLLTEPGGLPESAIDYLQFLKELKDVDPSQIRGVAFPSLGEAVDWLQSVGVISFSSVVQIGDAFYPVVGDSPGSQKNDTPENSIEDIIGSDWELDFNAW